MSSDLAKVLNLDPASKKDRNDYAGEFRRIATSLMNEFSLEVNGHSHRLAEIEFYYCHPNHEDVFAHQDELQRTNAQWYFHRQNGGSYKGGSYKGLDLTFGKPGEAFGGILIRAIENVKTGDYTEGSCLVVNKILELAGVNEIEEIVTKPKFSISADKDGILFLKKNTSLKALDIFASSRVGLTLKQTDGDRPFFIVKPYRFVSHPSLVRKGRQNLILRLFMDGKSAYEIQQITAAGAKNIQKYIDVYEATKKKPKDFEGANLGVEELSQLHYACK